MSSWQGVRKQGRGRCSWFTWMGAGGEAPWGSSQGGVGGMGASQSCADMEELSLCFHDWVSCLTLFGTSPNADEAVIENQPLKPLLGASPKFGSQ